METKLRSRASGSFPVLAWDWGELDLGEVFGLVEIGLAGKRSGADELGLGSAENEAYIHAGCGSKIQACLEKIERDSHGGEPGAVRSKLGKGGNIGHRDIHFIGPDSWGGELATPPSSVWGEIELEVAAGAWICEKKFGDVVLPEFCLEKAGPGFWVELGRAAVIGNEPEMAWVEDHGKSGHGLDGISMPILAKSEDWQVQFSPMEGLGAGENGHRG